MKMDSFHLLSDGFIPSRGIVCWTLESGNGRICVFFSSWRHSEFVVPFTPYLDIERSEHGS